MRTLATLVLILLMAIPAYAVEVNMALTQYDLASESNAYHIDAGLSRGEFGASIVWDYAEVGSISVVDKGYIKLGWDPALTDKWSIWMFLNAGYNHTRSIDSEYFIGFGPKYTFVDREGLKASMSIGLVTHILDGEELLRLSARPKLKYKKEAFSVALTAFYQPNVNKWSDYILSANMTTGYELTENTALKLVVEDEYRNETGENEITKMLMLGIKL